LILFKENFLKNPKILFQLHKNSIACQEIKLT
jgi:hypothetical protein